MLVHNVPVQDIKSLCLVCYKCNYNYWFHILLRPLFTSTHYTLPDTIFYTANDSKHCLESVFHDRLWPWSPWLADLNLCNFYLWGMLNYEVYNNNACSDYGLKKGIQSGDPTQQNRVCSSDMERVCEVINDIGQTNYGPCRVWLKHEKLFVTMSVWIHKTNGHLLSKQLCLQTVFWRYLFKSCCDYPDGGIAWFSSVLQENFKIVPQISPQRISSTSFPIQYSLITLACKAILHEVLTAPLHKPQINKYINKGYLPYLHSNISQWRKLENVISYGKIPTQINICLHNKIAKTYCVKITTYWIQIR